MGKNQSHVAISLYGVKSTSFRPHSMLQIGENWKSISCLCPKLLNFETGETTNVKSYIMRKLALKIRNCVLSSINELTSKQKIHDQSYRGV